MEGLSGSASFSSTEAEVLLASALIATEVKLPKANNPSALKNKRGLEKWR
jgi:hypothetical protein